MNQEQKKCPFLREAEKFADRHPVGCEITPVDLAGLNRVGVAEKSGRYPNTTRRVVCDAGACSGAIVMKLEYDQLAGDIGVIGQCAVLQAAAKAAQEAIQRSLTEPPDS